MDFQPVFLEECSYVGKLWSFPFNKSVRTLFYNRDLFSELGLDPDRPPTDWDQWRDDQGTATDFSDDTWTGNSTRSEALFTDNPGVDPANLNVFLPPGLHTGDSVRLAAHFQGLAKGASLKVTNEEGRLYAFSVYGMFSNLDAGEGEVLIEMGYRKRF